MKPPRNPWVAGVCLAILSLLAIGDTATAKPPARGIVIRSGPPAHAPAHGYRRKQVCGFELVFDVGLGVYVAVGVTDVYYHEGYFYRVRGGVWEFSLRGMTWGPAGIDKLPAGLQIKAKSMSKLNGNGNSLVKLNGNGPGGNPATDNNKPNGAVSANASKPNVAPNASVSKPVDNATQSKASSGATTAKPGTIDKSSGTSDAGASKPAAKPDASRKTKSAGKGKRK